MFLHVYLIVGGHCLEHVCVATFLEKMTWKVKKVFQSRERLIVGSATFSREKVKI